MGQSLKELVKKKPACNETIQGVKWINLNVALGKLYFEIDGPYSSNDLEYFFKLLIDIEIKMQEKVYFTSHIITFLVDLKCELSVIFVSDVDLFITPFWDKYDMSLRYYANQKVWALCKISGLLSTSTSEYYNAATISII